MKPARGIVLLALFAWLAPAAGAQEVSESMTREEVVERVLELKQQIEELLAALPPEVRAELRRRLAEAPAPQAETATPAATRPQPSAEGIPPLIERARRPECNTLTRLDENGDGKVDSADRYWRHVYLWTDRNGDRQVQDREVESAYDRKVREIAVSLETFIRAKGTLGEVRVDDFIVLDLRGDGFSDSARGDDGVLAVDADALGRGDGPRLLDAGGQPLAGIQPFRAGLRLDAAGAIVELTCP